MDSEQRTVTSPEPRRPARDAVVAPAWRSIVDLPVALAVFDRQMRYVAASDQWQRKFGLAGHNIIGESHYDLFPDLPERWKELLQRALAGETLAASDDCFERADGSRQWLNWEVRPWYDDTGDVGGIQIWAADVTARVVAELERAEAFHVLARGIPDLVWMTTPDGANVYSSPRYVEYTGQSMAESSGTGWIAVVHPDDMPRVGAAWQRATQDLTSYELEYRFRRADGVYRWFLVRALPQKDAAGRVLKWIGSCTDIDDLKRTAEALRASEARYRNLADDLAVGVLIQGPNAEIMLSNPRALELLGLTEDQLLGLTSFDPHWNVIHEDGTPFPGPTHPVPVALARRAPVQDVVMGVYRPLLRDRVWLLVNADPQLHADGTVREVICTFADISRQRALEAERAELAERLRQAEKLESVGQLAGGVAHDFNNQLGVILGHTELALQQVETTSPLHADLSGIRDAARRSAYLTRQLLTFARRQPIKPMVLDLNATVQRALTMLSRLIGEHVALVWRPAAAVWPVRADASQVEQILANLAVNARDAIDGDGSLTVTTANRVIDEAWCAGRADAVPGEYVQLTVTDDGGGISADVLAKIFEPFFTTKGVGKGTGLGLASVYGALRQSNGFVAVESVVGHGTTFDLFFPRTARASTEATASSVAAPHARGHETILLVEDEAVLRRIVGKVLEAQGYTVLQADDAQGAIRLALEHTGAISLLLTDVVMPGMDGPALAEALEDTNPQLRHLFMSGYLGHSGAVDVPQLDAEHFIAKPFTLAALGAKVRDVLDRA